MLTAVLLLVFTGLTWVSVGAAVGHVERSGYSLVRYQLLSCAVCVALGLVGWTAAPTAFVPNDGCAAMTWMLVVSAMLLCGVFSYLMIVMMGRAMRQGPNAIVWAIIQSGLVYPFLMGWLVFDVPMGPRRLCGIAFVVASVFLYAFRNGTANGAGDTDAANDAAAPHAPFREWLPPSLLGMLFCGINQCGASLPSYLEKGSEFSGAFRTFLIYFGLLLTVVAHIWIKRSRRSRAESVRPGEWRGLAVCAGCVGLVSFLANTFFMFPGLDRLERVGAGSMGYPVMVASCIAGFFAYGVLVLRERITPRQLLGAILGLAGIVFGCL